MTSVSAGHIILTPTQPVGSGRPQRESNPGPPHQESRALPTELPRPPPPPYSRTSDICLDVFLLPSHIDWDVLAGLELFLDRTERKGNDDMLKCVSFLHLGIMNRNGCECFLL